MPTRSHGKKRIDKPAAKQPRKKDATVKQDGAPKRKASLPANRLQLAACAAATFGAAGAYWVWAALLPSKVDLRPKPTLVVPRDVGMQAAPSFTLASSVPGCTIERGYANRHIVGPERFGISSPKECMKFCRESSCNCWSWKDDGFCRTGTAQTCNYIASEDDDRWMYGSCTMEKSVPPPARPTVVPLVPAQPAAAAAPELPFNPSLLRTSAPVALTTQGKGGNTEAVKGTSQVSTAAPAPLLAATQRVETSEKPQLQATGASKEDLLKAPKSNATVCPVLMITHQRAEYLKRALGSLFRYRTKPQTYPIIASQDGEDAEVKAVLQKYQAMGALQFLHFTPKAFLPTGYKRLSAHYGWALGQVFDVLGYQQVVILEEDLEIAVDFFSYFEATLPLLQSDPKLFCVSAWNDNGRPDLVQNATAIYRSDFFPGLGWMLLSSFWNEVKGKWPNEYWDDFLRRSDIRLERHCLRPEVSRTHTFGEKGVSHGQYYKQHLASNMLNDKVVDWVSMNLNHVATASAFDLFLSQQVKTAKLIRLEELQGNQVDSPIAVQYADKEWKKVAQHFGLMEDQKAGVRRGSYRGVLPFAWNGQATYLVRDWPLN